jgi:hypothetical protein
VNDNCNRHIFELAEAHCRGCREAYCGDCLVYTDGSSSPPMCIDCALKRSGVRGSRKSRPSWRERRAMSKLEKAHAKAQHDDVGTP